MRRIIDFNFIGETTFYLKQQVNILEDEKNKLLLDISKINECYNGKDADIIVSKYTEKAKSLNTLIEVMKNYNEYFAWLASSYKDIHKNASNKLETQIETYASNIANDEYNITFKLENIVNNHEKGDVSV